MLSISFLIVASGAVRIHVVCRRFVCPSCGNVATPEDWHKAGAPANTIAFSCVGRWMPNSTATIFEKGKGPCNYAGGGLFRLNPVIVESGDAKHEIFEFAEASPAASDAMSGRRT